jgi:precorrin-3B synthase
MTGPEVKGWCPGALRPMLSGDGWVVRIRPPEGRLTPAQTLAIADLAESCGNGQVQLTNRANLQLRGIRPETVGPLVDGLAAAGLVDPSLSPEAEARLNILVTPFWHAPEPLRPCFDTMRLWHLLRSALVAPDAPTLPSKFGFALDTGFGIRHLASDSADIRIESARDGVIVRADGMAAGRSVQDEGEALQVAMAMARWFAISGGVGPDGRGRMRDHIARGAALPDRLRGDVQPSLPATSAAAPLMVTPAFGQIAAQTLRRLAGHSRGALRITPWRAFHIPVVRRAGDLRRVPGLIFDPADPRLRVTACTGAPGCPQGKGATRDIAQMLGHSMPPRTTLHVSGCAKGCAHPGPATVTLVAQGNGRYGIVRQGTASDPATPVPEGVPLSTVLHDLVPDAPHL